MDVHKFNVYLGKIEKFTGWIGSTINSAITATGKAIIFVISLMVMGLYVSIISFVKSLCGMEM